MRAIADADRIERFMRAIGRAADESVRVYFTGGATAVMLGWRDSTIDIDVRIDPEIESVFRAIPRLKEELHLNVELASPLDFIPVKPGWEARSPYIASEGLAAFHHFDLYAQALAKVERGHAQDVEDVRHMIRAGLVTPNAAVEYFEAIAPQLYRYPALDPETFRRAVVEMFRERGGEPPSGA